MLCTSLPQRYFSYLIHLTFDCSTVRHTAQEQQQPQLFQTLPHGSGDFTDNALHLGVKETTAL